MEFIESGLPDELDVDGNGIPCEAEFPTSSGAFVNSIRWLEPGLFCRDLAGMDLSFADAVTYWLLEQAPDRMDADRNGIPCETIYPAEEIDDYFGN